MSLSFFRPQSSITKRPFLTFGVLAWALSPSLAVAQEQTPAVAPLKPATPATAEAAKPAPPLTGVPAALCAKLPSAPVDEADRTGVTAFYQARQCRPLWVDDRGRTEAADLAIAELGRADEWGLNPKDFKLVAAKQPISPEPSSPDALATADLEITAAVLRYAHQAEGARIPEPDKQLSSYLDRKPAITSASDILTRIADKPNPDEVLRSFQPQQEEFLKLKALLASLRGGTKDKASLFAIPKRGPMLASGIRDPDVATLKKRFDIASPPGDEQLFDDALTSAVKHFQASKGLHDDGIVGSATRAALAGNETASTPDKIEAVIANMEEWRWMPRDLGAAHILVNIPSFSILLSDNGKTLFNDRVVVGTAEKQTPIFSKNMTTIVLKPRWNIPDSIKLSMLLSGRSIEKQGYVVMRNGHVVDSTKINWAKADLATYTFYQPAGDDNALGLVKLLFPNKHSVYLHDTPSRYLFNEPVRLYSHGCMRVRNPQDFAQRIFDIDRGDKAPNVKQLVRNGPMDDELTLEHPVPVHVTYFTVWVDENGQPNYYNDWYGHQKRITLALAGKWNEIDVGKDHLAAVDTSALKEVRFSRSTKTKTRTRHTDDFDAPMGLTSSGGGRSSYRKYDNTVGDLIRQVLGF